MFSENVYKWLDNVLDYGISEHEFWNMTFAELERLLNSKKRVQKAQAQEKASFDYILADLIGRSVSRIYNSSAKVPDINNVYPTLFNNEEMAQKKQERESKLFAIKLKQFSDSFNKKLKQEVNR